MAAVPNHMPAVFMPIVIALAPTQGAATSGRPISASYPNLLRRYLVNEKTPGLKVRADGSIQLAIAHAKPAGAANWLPEPIKRIEMPAAEWRFK